MCLAFIFLQAYINAYTMCIQTFILCKHYVHNKSTQTNKQTNKHTNIHKHSYSRSNDSFDFAFSFESLSMAREGGARTKLLIELRSPMMHSAVEKTFLIGCEKILTLDQLYAQAMLLDPIFRVQIQRLAGMSCGYFPVAVPHSATSTELRL